MSTYRDAAVAAEIRKVYPKHSKTAYSLAKRTNETGVMLCPRAKEIAALYLGQKKPENRRMKHRICGRLPDELAEKVKAKLNGGSMQDLLVMLLTEWVARDDKERGRAEWSTADGAEPAATTASPGSPV